jgi:hypothetical protein
MGMVRVLLKGEHTMLCELGGDDRQAADALLEQVLLLRSQPGQTDSFVRCDNGGGFNAADVIGITVQSGPPAPSSAGGPPAAAAGTGVAQ